MSESVTSLPVPEEIRFGTSSWAYEGWKGMVYRKPYPRNRFAQDCLAEYAAYTYQGAPLFRTVGLDQTFYRPPTVGQLGQYVAQLPTGFRICSKVWEEITIPAYAPHARYGSKAGTANARFLDTSIFEDLVLRPSQEALGDHAGAFIFEFQRWGLEPARFLPELDRFLSRLPQGPHYAVETRNPAILGSRYRDLLTHYGVAHVYNHCSVMPPLASQHRTLGQTFTAQFVVIRLLTPLGLSHAEAVRKFSPYSLLVQPLPQMRVDTLALIRQAVAEQRSAYVLVNNRAEGNAPSTIQALVDALLPAEPTLG
ncbi:MAG: DUF72 domain-containing protein [Nitrospiraceae bacterium]